MAKSIKNHIEKTPGPEEIFYSVRWPATDSRPGAHPGSERGLGQQFLGYHRFLDYPDPRRLDLKATALDPFEIARIRSYAQRSAISVTVIADLSASMGFTASRFKFKTLAGLVNAIASAAERYGDPFGFIGCDRQVREDWILQSGYGIGRAESISKRLLTYHNASSTVLGLTDCYQYLPYRRSLVFLASDYHFEDSLVTKIAGSLTMHDVVPIVIWDTEEFSALPKRGLVRMRDLESGRSRMLWLRTGLKTRIEQRFAKRKSHLIDLFHRLGWHPVFVLDRLEARYLNEYFFNQ